MSHLVTSAKEITIVSAGDSAYEAGPGGFGVVLTYRKHRKELSGGFAKTRGRRLALAGAIAGLEVLNESCVIDLYIVQLPARAFSDMPPEAEKDLLDKIDALSRKNVEVRRHHVGSYDGHPEGLRCLGLAKKARSHGSLPPDVGYLNALARTEERKKAQEKAPFAETLSRKSSSDQARREQEAELALPAHIRSLRQQIRELTATINRKQGQLYTDTLDERAHDRLYELLRRDQENLERLKQALKEAEQERS